MHWTVEAVGIAACCFVAAFLLGFGLATVIDMRRFADAEHRYRRAARAISMRQHPAGDGLVIGRHWTGDELAPDKDEW